MGVMKGCVVWLALVGLFVVMTLVMGVRGCTQLANPTHFTRDVEETPDKTRRMLASFMATAEGEPAADFGLPNVATKTRVQDYSDGSTRLTLDAPDGRLAEIVVRTLPPRMGEEGTRIEVVSNATTLAERIKPKVEASKLHREIREQFDRALTAIDKHRVVPGGFTFGRAVDGTKPKPKRRYSPDRYAYYDRDPYGY